MCLACVVTNSRGLLGLPPRSRHEPSLNCKAPPCFNRSRSRHFLPSTCLRLCSSGFAPTPPTTRFACVRAWLRSSPFFKRADSEVLLTAINAQASASTFSVNQSAKNVARNQAAPSSRVSSSQDDPHTCFNKLQLRWQCWRAHRDTDLYWSLPEDPVSWFKNSGVITEWLLLLLIELDIPTSPGVKWTGHSLRWGGASVAHAIDVSIAVIMSWGLWKSLVSALL